MPKWVVLLCIISPMLLLAIGVLAIWIIKSNRK